MHTNRHAGPFVILVVDDEEANVCLLEAILKADGYETIAARNGNEALVLAAQRSPDLVLVDVMMPEIDGFETVARLKADPRTKTIPVIMVTALDDRESKLRALEAGAEEFVTKPVDIADVTVRVRNLLRLKAHSDFLENYNEILAGQVSERTAQLEEAYREMVYALVRAAEHKDEETGHHVRRISFYCRLLAAGMEMTDEFNNSIYLSSPMHDIGKIGVPDHILLKPGPFSPEEWDIMKTHCAMGASILSSGRSPYTVMGAEIALNHHERWDGTGYPAGRRGEEIPLAARIMQICDVYDALRSRRPYKPPLDHARAVTIIAEGDGRTQPQHFDPAVLACFLSQANRFEAIYNQFADS